MSVFQFNLFILFFYMNMRSISAAHARKRQILRTKPISQHDRQVTTFSTQGELLQLQYAQSASSRGSPSIFIQIDNQTILFLCRSSHRYGDQMSDGRVAHVPNRSVFRIHDSILSKFTGLQGDARLLSKHLRANAMLMHSNFGIEEYSQYLNVQRIAELCADVQHSLTIRSGARPLAVQAVFMGKSGKDTLSLWNVHVGGSMERCQFCVSGNMSLLGIQEHVVLQQMHDLSKRLIETGDETTISSDTPTLSQVIQILGRMLFGEVNSSSDKNTVSNDIYVISIDPTSRGGIRIKCATCIQEEDLERVSKMFHGSQDHS